MDRRFLALIAAAFVLAFAVCWVWFAPAAPTPQTASQAPAAAASAPAATPPPTVSQDPPPPPPSYHAEPDPTVVHRLG